jgi:hypothetical protein
MLHENIRPEQHFTVVLNTWKRNDMLNDALQHYSNCPVVKYIHVVWCDSDLPPADLEARFHIRMNPQVFFDYHPDSLNRCLIPAPHVYT